MWDSLSTFRISQSLVSSKKCEIFSHSDTITKSVKHRIFSPGGFGLFMICFGRIPVCNGPGQGLGIAIDKLEGPVELVRLDAGIGGSIVYKRNTNGMLSSNSSQLHIS